MRQCAWKPSWDSCCAQSLHRTGYARIRRRHLAGFREPWLTARAWLMACGDNPDDVNMTMPVSLLWVQTERAPVRGEQTRSVAS
eukprot:6175260-Pleurochrysis_carterae.AAC.3